MQVDGRKQQRRVGNAMETRSLYIYLCTCILPMRGCQGKAKVWRWRQERRCSLYIGYREFVKPERHPYFYLTPLICIHASFVLAYNTS